MSLVHGSARIAIIGIIRRPDVSSCVVRGLSSVPITDEPAAGQPFLSN